MTAVAVPVRPYPYAVPCTALRCARGTAAREAAAWLFAATGHGPCNVWQDLVLGKYNTLLWNNAMNFMFLIGMLLEVAIWYTKGMDFFIFFPFLILFLLLSNISLLL